jgi:hypothetical protein
MGLKRSAFILAPVVSAALLWGQAASAAAPVVQAQVDPLVALSALSTAGSAGAVCAGATGATVAASQAAVAGAPAGCVLPVPEAAAPPPAPEAAPLPPPPVEAGAGFNVLPLLLGLAAVAAVIAVVALGHHHGSGNLQPVSPA